MVAAGNWPWWLICRLARLVGSILTNTDRGTALPVNGEVKYTALNRSGVV